MKVAYRIFAFLVVLFVFYVPRPVPTYAETLTQPPAVLPHQRDTPSLIRQAEQEIRSLFNAAKAGAGDLVINKMRRQYGGSPTYMPVTTAYLKHLQAVMWMIEAGTTYLYGFKLPIAPVIVTPSMTCNGVWSAKWQCCNCS